MLGSWLQQNQSDPFWKNTSKLSKMSKNFKNGEGRGFNFAFATGKLKLCPLYSFSPPEFQSFFEIPQTDKNTN
jgi:hypothetical protein